MRDRATLLLITLWILTGLLLGGGAPATLAENPNLLNRVHPREDYVWPHATGPYYGSVDASIRHRPGVLHTLVGSFDLTAGTPDLPSGLLANENADSRSQRYYLVMLDPSLLAAGEIDRLEAELASQGCGVVGRTAVAGLVVRADAVCLPTLDGMPAVLARERYHPAFKLSPSIGRVPLAHAALVASEFYNLTVQLFPGEDTEPVVAALAELDGGVLDVGVDRIRVRLPKSRLEALASIEAVQVIHESAPVFPFGEETTATIQTGNFLEGAIPYHDAGIRGDGGGVVDTTQVLMVLDDGISLDAGDLSHTCHDAGWDEIGSHHRKVLGYFPASDYGGYGDQSSCDALGGFTHGHAVSAVALGNGTDVDISYDPSCEFIATPPTSRKLDGVAPRAKLVFVDAHSANDFIASISGDQVAPPSGSTATGQCDFVLEEDNLFIYCTHDLSSPSYAGIFLGPPGHNGPLVFDFPDPESPIDERWDSLTEQIISDLWAGNYYVEIVGSEIIRGQIVATGCETVGGESVHPLTVGTIYDSGGDGSLPDAYDIDARTFNFSWGTLDNSVYGPHAQDVDRFLVDYPEAMLFIAAGNLGAGTAGQCDNGGATCQINADCAGQGGVEVCLFDQISDPATAKNAIVVGATLSPNPRDNPDHEARWPDSSRGPAGVSNRVAPILMAPGADDDSTDDTRTAFACRSSDRDQDNPVECDIDEGHSGTSYAAAASSGAAMLIRDYFAQGFYPDGSSLDPDNVVDLESKISGALVKSILVASADWMNDALDPDLPGTDLSVPYRFNNEQGYGRIQLSNALPLTSWPDSPTGLLVADVVDHHPLNSFGGTINGVINVTYPEEQSGAFTFCDDTGELRVALTWVEGPDAGNVGVLQNDLDLEIESPSGKIYIGNFFTDDQDRNGVFDSITEDCPDSGGSFGQLEAGPWSIPINDCVGPVLRDTDNPTEAIFLPHPVEPGDWTVRILSSGTGLDEDQEYALAVAGGSCMESSIRILHPEPGEYRLKVVELDEAEDPASGLTEAEISARTTVRVLDPSTLAVLDEESGFPFVLMNDQTLRFESVLPTIGCDWRSTGNGLLEVRAGDIIDTIYNDQAEAPELRYARAIVTTIVEECVLSTEADALIVRDYDAMSENMTLQYTTGCAASDHTIVYGALENVSSYDYSGQDCFIGTSGSHVFNPGSGSFFFLVVANDDAGIEGSYGTDSDGIERPAYSAAPFCPYVQDLSLTCFYEWICDDSLDNDGDGPADCLDLDCNGFNDCEFGFENSCNDSLDNDGDGATDCLDLDCDGSDSCEFGLETTCDDFFDNDGDGAADCLDPDCNGVDGCAECPIGWWPGDGDATDVAYYGNDGTLIGGASFAPGVEGEAFSLDGDDDYVLMGDVDSMENMTELTIELWANFDSFGSAGCGENCMPLVTKWNSCNLENNAYALMESDSELWFFVPTDSGCDTLAAPHGMVAGQWYHIAAVFTPGSPGSLEIYVNGESIGTGPTTADTIGNSTRALRIGDWNHAYDDNYLTFDGLLDEVTIHDRALDRHTIQNIWGNGHDEECRLQPE